MGSQSSYFRRNLDGFGRYGTFVVDILKASLRPPWRFHLYMAEMERIGVNSVMIITLSSLAIGMIFALQMVALLQPYQAEVTAGMAVALAMAREFAPIITTLMLIAKNGSAMTAEIGTMKVTEQIDALEAMSVDPLNYLVLPRVWASVIIFPTLTLLSNVIGVTGAYAISIGVYRIDSATYLSRMFTVLRPVDVYSGLIKASIMGFIVATICTYYGMNSGAGAKGVGDSSTKAVVASSVSILVADYFLASIMMAVLY